MSGSLGPQIVAEVGRLAEEITTLSTRPARLMEVCGTHSHAVARYGIGQLLPGHIELLSGPGCPVCVTPTGQVDAALELARRPGVTIATFGDMIRVPGSDSTLAEERARGAGVKVIFSPMEAVDMAEAGLEVVLLGVGFDTTAPGVAVAVAEAARRDLDTFSILCAHKLLIPALHALLAADDVAIDGLIGPGHVSTIIGSDAYLPVVERFHIPCVIAGFEATDIMRAVLALVRQIEAGAAVVENEYPRAVAAEGNPQALEAMYRVFEPCDSEWRGMGVIPGAGLKLREEYRRLDALARYGVELHEGRDDPRCRCGEVLRGALRPDQCGAFGRACTPEHPLGPCMVSSEGACAAVYKYRPID
ncbi:MAG: hydrogenase formation protein HypD [Armatimonadetes bacterium]|nr:hydrogenase formation protein HypD [Armatimonadota bacterium]